MGEPAKTDQTKTQAAQGRRQEGGALAESGQQGAPDGYRNRGVRLQTFQQKFETDFAWSYKPEVR